MSHGHGPVPLMQVDAFTLGPFSGNPAAVCWLEEPRSESWMQSVAAEMNLSETAFLEPRADGYGLRWFTPVTEVNLCGHATLGSAHALEAWGKLAVGETARFLTRSGWLTAKRQDEWIELDFPAGKLQGATIPAGLGESLGHPQMVYCGRGAGPLGENYVLEVRDEEAVRGVKPDFAKLRSLPLRSVAVTAAAGAGTGYDFVSRFFAPGGGVEEDPVTGSAHTQLTPYWAQKLGRDQMVARQASARGGELRVELRGERVGLAGRCRTVFHATLEV